MIPLSHVLVLSLVLFTLGVTGFLIRRNVITVFMCIELMLNAVNLAFIAFARHLPNLDGQLFVIFNRGGGRGGRGRPGNHCGALSQPQFASD